jgi:tetratricopeptide (TPR) repeat protein
MLAKAYEKNKELALAVSTAKKATDLDKKNYDIKRYYAELQVSSKDYKGAIDTYKDLTKANAISMDDYIDLANVYLLQNDYSNAIKTFDVLEKNMGLSEEITQQKQLLYLKLNKVDEALKEGGKLISAEPQDASYVIQQAQLMITNGRLKEAQEMLEKSISLQDGFAEAHVILAEIYRKQGDMKSCNRELVAAFDNKGLSVDTKLKILGSYMGLLKTQKTNEGVDDLIVLSRKLIELDPEEARGYVFLGDLLVLKNELSEARRNYILSTKYDKSVFEVWMAIIELDSSLEDTKSLVKHATEAADYFPNQSYFWYNAGLGNYALKQYEEAVYQLDEAKMLAFENPELLKNILTLQGDAYNEIKSYWESEKAYEEALKIDPDYSTALNNYSYFLSLRKSSLPKAKAMSKKLLLQNPENPTFMDTHAWVLFQLGEYEDARIILANAVSLSNPSISAVEHYGDVLYKLGNKTEALVYWKKAIEMGSTNPLLSQKISKEQYIE